MIQRNLLPSILAAISDTPVVFLRGARQTGKSTLMLHIAEQMYPARYMTLDNAVTLSAAASDPVGFLSGLEKPVVIDEIQRVPELFLAIKEDVDRNRSPGRYLLTGSASNGSLPRISDALVGRMEALTLWPLSLTEKAGGTINIIDALFDPSFPKPLTPAPDFELYEHMITGGFPEPFGRRPRR